MTPQELIGELLAWKQCFVKGFADQRSLELKSTILRESADYIAKTEELKKDRERLRQFGWTGSDK
jgi:hypothetical protein